MKKILAIAGNVIKELFRRKDFYFILTLLVAIVVYAGSFSFGGEKDFSRYYKEIVLSMVYIFSVIIAVSFAAREIPQEIESKNIYPLLAKPVGRGGFIFGKFLGTAFISIISLSLFYFVFIVSLLLRKDFSTPWVMLFEGYYLQALLLLFISSITIFLSLFLTPSANISVSLLLYFSSSWFGITVPGYIFLPHMELFDIKEKIIHTQDIIPGWIILFLSVYAACYALLFLYASYLVFRKRDL